MSTSLHCSGLLNVVLFIPALYAETGTWTETGSMEYSAGKHDWADGVHIRVVYYRASKLFQKNDRDFFLREYCDRDFYEKSCAAFSAGYAEARL